MGKILYTQEKKTYSERGKHTIKHGAEVLNNILKQGLSSLKKTIQASK